MNRSLRIVLVRPLKPRNLGSIARLMTNFGVNELVLVTPRIDLEDDQIGITARRSMGIIHQAIVTDSLQKALEGSNTVIGTTARVGGDKNLPRVALFPDELNFSSFTGKTSLVFGTESDGLSNTELMECNFLVTIPTNSEYPAMNLSHAVAIMLYNFKLKFNSVEHQHHRKANRTEISVLLEQVMRITEIADVRECKKKVSQQAFENLIRRSWITGREAHTLIGLFKKIYYSLEEEYSE